MIQKQEYLTFKTVTKAEMLIPGLILWCGPGLRFDLLHCDTVPQTHIYYLSLTFKYNIKSMTKALPLSSYQDMSKLTDLPLKPASFFFQRSPSLFTYFLNTS